MSTQEQTIDTQVGLRVRQLRREAKLSQTELGRRIGVTFQQVQKYENGSNRIAASKLWLIAECVGVNVSVLMSDFPPVAGSGPSKQPETRLLEAWATIDPMLQKTLLDLIESLAAPSAASKRRRKSGSEGV